MFAIKLLTAVSLLMIFLGISCFPPPTIANGKHSGIDRGYYDYGSAVTYNCKSGFSLIGDKTTVCTTDENGIEGEWSKPAPKCEGK